MLNVLIGCFCERKTERNNRKNITMYSAPVAQLAEYFKYFSLLWFAEICWGCHIRWNDVKKINSENPQFAESWFCGNEMCVWGKGFFAKTYWPIHADGEAIVQRSQLRSEDHSITTCFSRTSLQCWFIWNGCLVGSDHTSKLQQANCII